MDLQSYVSDIQLSERRASPLGMSNYYTMLHLHSFRSEYMHNTTKSMTFVLTDSLLKWYNLEAVEHVPNQSRDCPSYFKTSVTVKKMVPFDL